MDVYCQLQNAECNTATMWCRRKQQADIPEHTVEGTVCYDQKLILIIDPMEQKGTSKLELR